MNPLEGIIQQLLQRAGPRGATFAGRRIQPDDTLASILSRFPQGETESGGAAIQAPQLSQALMASTAFGRLPPWLLKKLPTHIQKLTHTAQARINNEVAVALSQDPLHPIKALESTWTNYTDVERAALVMSSSLMGGTPSISHLKDVIRKSGRLPSRTLYENDIQRLLLPEKLAELKRWAHSVLAEGAFRK